MTIVVDAARAGGLQGGKHNTDYQKGNDHPDTPNATWLTFINYLDGTAETPIVPKDQNTPTDNTGDTWAPHVEQTFLDSTPQTERFTPKPTFD